MLFWNVVVHVLIHYKILERKYQVGRYLKLNFKDLSKNYLIDLITYLILHDLIRYDFVVQFY